MIKRFIEIQTKTTKLNGVSKTQNWNWLEKENPS